MFRRIQVFWVLRPPPTHPPKLMTRQNGQSVSQCILGSRPKTSIARLTFGHLTVQGGDQADAGRHRAKAEVGALHDCVPTSFLYMISLNGCSLFSSA
jgi:hypothetical protein